MKKLNQERIDKEDALFQLELDLMKDRQLAERIALKITKKSNTCTR